MWNRNRGGVALGENSWTKKPASAGILGTDVIMTVSRTMGNHSPAPGSGLRAQTMPGQGLPTEDLPAQSPPAQSPPGPGSGASASGRETGIQRLVNDQTQTRTRALEEARAEIARLARTIGIVTDNKAGG